MACAQIGIIGFDGQVERGALQTRWDLPSPDAGATAKVDVTVRGQRGDFADPSREVAACPACA